MRFKWVDKKKTDHIEITKKSSEIDAGRSLDLMYTLASIIKPSNHNQPRGKATSIIGHVCFNILGIHTFSHLSFESRQDLNFYFSFFCEEEE